MSLSNYVEGSGCLRQAQATTPPGIFISGNRLKSIFVFQIRGWSPKFILDFFKPSLFSNIRDIVT